MASVVVPYGIELTRLLVSSGPVYPTGDLALVDLAVRSATRFQQVLGPYDRFGWHHPGPAYFYLLALPS
ncbi:MAG TPA: hypothetical protein VMB72_06315, partial [Acidimicrobiales bacterium]|nr:hypothetical protein [Acidimicrobiales bacterium]